jgi:hypothetical protein
MDPDPGGPKTCGSGSGFRSGSATLTGTGNEKLQKTPYNTSIYFSHIKVLVDKKSVFKLSFYLLICDLKGIGTGFESAPNPHNSDADTQQCFLLSLYNRCTTPKNVSIISHT